MLAIASWAPGWGCSACRGGSGSFSASRALVDDRRLSDLRREGSSGRATPLCSSQAARARQLPRLRSWSPHRHHKHEGRGRRALAHGLRDLGDRCDRLRALFWELDAGGPAVRIRAAARGKPDFQFRRTNRARREGLVSASLGLAYLALTNAIAFSPTDCLPLSLRAKATMGVSRRSRHPRAARRGASVNVLGA